MFVVLFVSSITCFCFFFFLFASIFVVIPTALSTRSVNPSHEFNIRRQIANAHTHTFIHKNIFTYINVRFCTQTRRRRQNVNDEQQASVWRSRSNKWSGNKCKHKNNNYKLYYRQQHVSLQNSTHVYGIYVHIYNAGAVLGKTIKNSLAAGYLFVCNRS